MKVNWFFYKISWGWYEDYQPYEFASEKEYTNEQLELVVLNAMMSGIVELDTSDSWIGNDALIDTAIKHLPKDFIPIKYQANYNLWGSCIIQENDPDYVDKLPTKLKEIVYAHNKRIEEEIMSSRKPFL
jgi:hypothetical protein